MYAQDAAELFPSDDDEESITLNPEERKAVRKRLEKANELDGTWTAGLISPRESCSQ
jgi:hypothetical protein